MDIQLPRPIARIEYRCSEQTKTALVDKMQLHEKAILTDEILDRARETATAYNERLAVLVKQSLRQQEYLKAAPGVRETFKLTPIDDGVTVVIWDRAIPPQRIRVDGAEHKGRLIENPMPIRGRDEVHAPVVVKLGIVIATDGRILEVDPLAGPGPLISPAVDAVRRWKYQPTLLNGRPVEVETTVDVPFLPA